MGKIDDSQEGIAHASGRDSADGGNSGLGRVLKIDDCVQTQLSRL